MKSIITTINEALTISSNTKVTKPYELLNKKINSIEDMIPICKDYFELLGYNIKVTNLSKNEVTWNNDYYADGYRVGDHFSISFYNNANKRTKLLRFGVFNEYMLMQVVTYYSSKPEPCKIHGDKMCRNTFKFGDNFLDFIMQIKERTEQNKLGRDINLMLLFKDIYKDKNN